MLGVLGRSDLRARRRPPPFRLTPRRHPRADGPDALGRGVDPQGPRQVRPHHRQRPERGGAGREGLLRNGATSVEDFRQSDLRRALTRVLLAVQRDAHGAPHGVRRGSRVQAGEDGLRPAFLDAPDARQGRLRVRHGHQG